MLEVPYWDAARRGGGGADADGAAPEPPRPADYLTPYLPLAAAVGLGTLSAVEAAEARNKCLQVRLPSAHVGQQ